MADLVAVNKADGEQLANARQTRQAYKNALHLMPPKPNGWLPRVLTCSALQQTGLQEIWEQVLKFEKQVRSTGFFEENRKEQALFWFRERIDAGLHQMFFENERIRDVLEKVEEEIKKGGKSPFLEAQKLLDIFSGKL